VRNVYAEIGTAFANLAVANPRFAAAFVGTLVRGMGAERVLWGQRLRLARLAAVAGRSPAAPGDPRRHAEAPRLRPAGPADGIVKTAIFSGNAARLYGIEVRAALGAIRRDQIAAIKAEHVARAAGGAIPPTATSTAENQSRRSRCKRRAKRYTSAMAPSQTRIAWATMVATQTLPTSRVRCHKASAGSRRKSSWALKITRNARPRHRRPWESWPSPG
jgi:hypothetical protein